MKTFTMAALLACLLAVPVVRAADDEDHAGHHPDASANDDKAAAPRPDRMQERMKKMQEQMQKIHATRDPKERQKLMEEHMESMRKGMKMMHGMDRKPKGERPPQDGGEKGAENSGEIGEMMGGMMMKKHTMMEDRLDAMQKMMEQMLEHEAAEQEMERGK